MKDVLLKITGKILTYDNGKEISEDVMEFITEGQIQSRGRMTMLVYPEMDETGLGDCTTHITISPSKVKVRREMENDRQSVMEFEKGKRYDGWYVTPYGPMSMELLTNSITPFEAGEDGKKTLSIDYSMSLKGLAETRNRLDIKILRDIGENENEQ